MCVMIVVRDIPTLVERVSKLHDYKQGRVPCVFIHGTGGVGKTQFVLHLARKLHELKRYVQ